MSQSSVASEATRWVVQIQTARCLDEFWPAFEAWLSADQTHWNAFAQAEERWLRLDWLKMLAARDDIVAQRLRALANGQGGVRSRLGYFCIVLGISVAMSLLALI